MRYSFTVVLVISAFFPLLTSSRPALAEVNFQWLGISGFSLNDGKTTLLFDPVITRPSLIDIGFNRKAASDEAEVKRRFESWSIKSCDAVFLSHEHFDHALDAVTVIKNYGGKLYGDSSALNLGKGLGLSDEKMISMKVGSTTEVGKFKVTSFNSPHPGIIGPIYFAPGEIKGPLSKTSNIWDLKTGESVSFLIEHPEGKIFFQQTSTLPNPDPAAALKVEVLLQGIANRKGSQEIIDQRIKKMGVKRVIPLHFDDFFKPISEPVTKELFGVKTDEFLKSVKEQCPAVQVDRPKYGEKVKLF
jgi:L-ascorbate metabolism protein UlaG (beta-lactamase superfamily)